MSGERYQLVAIDENNNEYIIELNNDNKNNKGKLYFIDRGVTRFQNPQHLASHLYEEGKIPNVPVKFVIRYNHVGIKELPLIFYDGDLLSISKNADDEAKISEIALKYYLKLEEMLQKYGFYNYLRTINNRNSFDKKSGNFLKDRLIDNIRKLYENFILTQNPTSEKVEIQFEIMQDLTEYKQLRTLHSFYKTYENMYVNNFNEVKEFDKKTTFETITKRESAEIPEIPQELQKAYDTYGMDGVWAIADAEDVVDKGYKFK